MQVLSNYIHVVINDGSDPAKVTIDDNIDGTSRVMAIRVTVGQSDVVFSGDMGAVMAWLGHTVKRVSEAINVDAERTVAQVVGEAEEYAYRRAEDAIERERRTA